MPDQQETSPDRSNRPLAIRLTATELAAVRGGRRVFAGLSFTVAAGELLAVTGPNGSGKSTLLRLIAGLVKPAAGHVGLEPASGEKAATRLHYVGHLDGLKAVDTVRQNLQFWADLWGTSGQVDAALAAIGLESLANLPVSVLSAGQRRRVALARLMVAKRPIWLLDEPATALDAAGEARLGHLIGDHLAAGGLAIVATHLDLPVKPAATLALGAA
jgi:heme exporter protein A